MTSFEPVVMTLYILHIINIPNIHDYVAMPSTRGCGCKNLYRELKLFINYCYIFFIEKKIIIKKKVRDPATRIDTEK